MVLARSIIAGVPWRPQQRGSVIVVERDGQRAAVLVTERITENNGMSR
jgi:hypothetical protein